TEFPYSTLFSNTDSPPFTFIRNFSHPPFQLPCVTSTDLDLKLNNSQEIVPTNDEAINDHSLLDELPCTHSVLPTTSSTLVAVAPDFSSTGPSIESGNATQFPSIVPEVEPVVVTQSFHPMQTRSKYGIHKPTVLLAQSVLVPSYVEPQTVQEALITPHWKAAIQDEYLALI
ncbi:hypothetical protein PanWU01x14_009260, partial [Parasponia andersonii]